MTCRCACEGAGGGVRVSGVMTATLVVQPQRRLAAPHIIWMHAGVLCGTPGYWGIYQNRTFRTTLLAEPSTRHALWTRWALMRPSAHRPHRSSPTTRRRRRSLRRRGAGGCCTRGATGRAAHNAARRDRSDEVFVHSVQQCTEGTAAALNGVTGACILLGGVRNRLVRERDVQPVRLE